MGRFKAISVYEHKRVIEGYCYYDKELRKHYILNDNLVRFEVEPDTVRQLICGNWFTEKELNKIIEDTGFDKNVSCLY